MKTLNLRRKREYTSMFDPFRELIEKCLMDGMTVRETLAQLPEGYVYDSLYTYIRVNKLNDGNLKGEIDARHRCDTCEYMKIIKNKNGKYDKSHRLCTKSWQILNMSVVCCPRWCELEQERIHEIEFRQYEN